MPAPISQFGYNINGNVVSFMSYSDNVTADTKYLWDFGDGNISTLQNPIHTFLQASYYLVRLTVENVYEGLPSELDEMAILVNMSIIQKPPMFNDISAIIDLYCPTQVIGTVRNSNRKTLLIAKWQTYLQPLLFEPEVSPLNTYSAISYPVLANILIAKLVIIGIIEMETAAFLLEATASGVSSGSSSGSGSSTTTSNGGIKSIETGPTKVERYENKDSSSRSEMMSNLSKVYTALAKPGGILDELKASACQDAQRISVYLPMCGPLPSSNRGIRITNKDTKDGYNANPFGITERMT